MDFEVPGETKADLDDEMSVGELMELRYMQAEREKEQVSTSCIRIFLS